jgi:hypothetical protein
MQQWHGGWCVRSINLAQVVWGVAGHQACSVGRVMCQKDYMVALSIMTP